VVVDAALLVAGTVDGRIADDRRRQIGRFAGDTLDADLVVDLPSETWLAAKRRLLRKGRRLPGTGPGLVETA